RLYGRGAFTLNLVSDFSRGAGVAVGSINFDAYNAGFPWDSGAWDSGVWGANQWEGSSDNPVDVRCHHASLALSATVTSSASAPPLLGDGSSPEVGAFALYSVLSELIPLGGL